MFSPPVNSIFKVYDGLGMLGPQSQGDTLCAALGFFGGEGGLGRYLLLLIFDTRKSSLKKKQKNCFSGWVESETATSLLV